jgi:hypothetical protein
MTFSGVHQTTPLGTFASAFSQASSGTASVNVSSAGNELVFDTVACANCSFLSTGSGQTQRWNYTLPDGMFPSIGAGSTEAGAASVTMSWGQGFPEPWAIGGVSIKPVAGGAIAFDAPSKNTSSTAVRLTVPHAVGTGAQTVLVVGVNIFSTTDLPDHIKP